MYESRQLAEDSRVVEAKQFQRHGRMEDIKLASLELTHVYYDANDPFGLPSAFLALVPQALLVAYVVAIYSRREVETACAFAGQLACEALNWILKRTIRQERPRYTAGIGRGYGMPSSHSQFMGFIAAYACLWLIFQVKTMNNVNKLIRIAFVVALAGAVCLSRVHLFYHSGQQVIVGVTIGTACGIIWFFLLTQCRRFGLVDFILDLGLVQKLHFKDTNVEDALPIEWQQERLRRQKSKAS